MRTFAGSEIAEQIAVMHAMELASLRPAHVRLCAEHTQHLRLLDALNHAEFGLMYLPGQLAGLRELLALHQPSAGSDAPDERIISTIAIAGIEQNVAMRQVMQGSRN